MSKNHSNQKLLEDLKIIRAIGFVLSIGFLGLLLLKSVLSPFLSLVLVVLFIGVIIFWVIKLNVIIKTYGEVIENTKNEALQIAHDLRSPLAALEMFIQSKENFPEEKRNLIQSAVGRIKDIANELAGRTEFSDKVEEKKQFKIEKENLLENTLLSSIIESIISEKRFQYRSVSDLRVEFKLTRENYGIFSQVSLRKLKEELSCIMDDILKDCLPGPTQGTGIKVIVLLLRKHEGRCEIQVFVESSSQKTQPKSITLEISASPQWFVQQLKINSSLKVVILDDDDSIHQMWKGRFESVMYQQAGVELIHFSSCKSIENWLQQLNPNLMTQYLFLFDYEILGESISGLDLIEKFKLGSMAILVTSRFEEVQLRERCERLGVKLIPKSFMGFVPLEINTQGKEVKMPLQNIEADFVLIDDDPIVHTIWRAKAKKMGVQLKSYYSEQEILPFIHCISKHCPIYIDSSLSDGVKGEEVAKRMNEKGFENIYLATGYDPSYFGSMPWIQKIVGKDPPF